MSLERAQEEDIKQLEMRLLTTEQDAWAWYRVICQFRFSYLSFLVLMVIVMFSFSVLMEVFFSVFLPSAQAAPGFILRSLFMLGALPILIILLSYVFEESTRLFRDALDSSEGSLPNFRLSLAVVIHYIRHYREMPLDDVPRHITYDPYSEDKPLVDDTIKEKEQKELVHRHMRPLRRWQLAIRSVIRANRAAVVFGTTQYNGPPIDYSTFVLVDFICPILFELVTAVAALLVLFDTFSISDAFYRYLRVGFYTMGFYLALWMVCHYWSSRNARMRELVANYHRTRRELEKKIQAIVHEETFKSFWLLDLGFRFVLSFRNLVDRATACIAPAWSCCKSKRDDYVEIDAAAVTPVAGDEANTLSGKALALRERVMHPWRKLTLDQRLLVLIPCLILSAYLSLAVFFLGWPIMGFFLVVGTSTIQRRWPQIFGNAFRHFVISFVLVSFVFFSMAFVVGTFVTGGDFHVEPPHANVVQYTPLKHWGDIPRYPICDLQKSGLNIIDFILIADAAYGSNTSLQIDMLHKRFDNTALKNWNFTDFSDKNSDHQCWFQVDFLDVNATVVAIRGTASAADALEDMHYWFGITIMQFANVFIPFLNQLPLDFVVQLLSMNMLERFTPEPVYMPVLRKVQALKASGKNVILTGHSLGGAMAAMVGAATKSPAISFSGPGLVFSRGRFHINEEDVRDYVVTIKPQNDIVPRVDVLGGLVQDIECRKNNPLFCHGSSTHACELYMTCGDKRGRDWSQAKQCIPYVQNPSGRTDL
ncbi:hypothetical protein SPRG_07912 [Saprolegnia parasitica CBS 223.65]|uniref:Fungal lipase-type domain-containing protein n=1 Tax=Saprolegnia parasitica (strain CBS 223.65) TaxID=695850 RepID=A0A067C6U5_SAPPC|nr:hypothetical protein SPRG_07912 [Saprolegnia parasitica CBS 223.65]KDO26509.1 hypothetical protein SPRG_07912 [Saprolegnia parasitica CBS 223.65]|eukprot:XP_012202654.1 hypothetical protein SPRG_07912 [Saprolegnia parasitica CBS 223.65]